VLLIRTDVPPAVDELNLHALPLRRYHEQLPHAVREHSDGELSGVQEGLPPLFFPQVGRGSHTIAHGSKHSKHQLKATWGFRTLKWQLDQSYR